MTNTFWDGTLLCATGRNMKMTVSPSEFDFADKHASTTVSEAVSCEAPISIQKSLDN